MRIIQSVTQGTDQWKELRAKHFTASEAPAALGLSKYQTRSELLHAKATGEVEAINEHTQKLFDKGHAAEELARKIAEKELGEELYPATITNEIDGLKLLASMDGMDIMEEQGWENKLWNAEFAEQVKNNVVPDTHWPQLEHQMIVSECTFILFSVSDGTEDNYVSVKYESKPERRQQVINGWKQFQEDLAEYDPAEHVKVEKVEASPIRDLPAINYKMDGLALISNLDEFKAASDSLLEKSQAIIETDQDFANAESRQKIFTKAEKDIKDIADRVLGEVADIDKFTKDLRYIGEQIRQARLAEGKQIKSRKEEIRGQIASKSIEDVNALVSSLMNELKLMFIFDNAAITNAMKGKKTIDTLQDAAETAVAKLKIEINEQAAIARANIETLKELAKDHEFLFADWKDVAFKANDDFAALVKTRIADHKEAEQERINAERERIRAEEQEKAKRELEEAEKAKQEAYMTMPDTSDKPPKNEDPVKKQKTDFIDSQVKHAQNDSCNDKDVTHAQLTDYQKGYIDALTQYAHWEDGAQYVGTTGKTLRQAIDDFLLQEAA